MVLSRMRQIAEMLRGGLEDTPPHADESSSEGKLKPRDNRGNTAQSYITPTHAAQQVKSQKSR